MPQMKKSNLTQEQLDALLKARNNASMLKLSPQQRFALVAKEHNRKFKVRIKKFHFKAIEDGSKIVLFNGLGKELGVFNNDHKGKRECRIFALYEIFLKTPEENRQGGYKFDFCQ
jgi:hypothetical protein